MLVEFPVSMTDVRPVEHERPVDTQLSLVAEYRRGVGEQCLYQFPADDVQGVGAVAERYVLHDRCCDAQIKFYRRQDIRQLVFSYPLTYAG